MYRILYADDETSLEQIKTWAMCVKRVIYGQ